jgi:hypothetical protein
MPGRDWKMSGGTGQSPIGAFSLGILNRVEICSNLHFHFILHTPLNSTMFLNSRNIKISYSTG